MRFLFLTLLLICLLLPTRGHAQPSPDAPAAPAFSYRKIEAVTHLGRPHFRVVTPAATYLYDAAGGGFSSIIDPGGNDWVDFKMEPWGEYPAAAASAFRGTPNLVFGSDDGGAGHPGHDRCESRIVGRNKIHTVSKSGDWAWTVTFRRDHVRLRVDKAPAGVPYWFLYEGTPGGTYAPQTYYWATDTSEPSFTVHDHYSGKHYEGHHRYLVFGEADSPYSLVVAQKNPDTHVDHVSTLGNEEIGAAASPDGMIVAGLGRGPNATPLMTGQNTFYLSLTPFNWTDVMQRIQARKKIAKLLRR